MRFRLFKIKPKSSLLLYHASPIKKNKGEETRNQKMRFRPFKINPKSSPGAPKPFPKPLQNLPKSSPRELLAAFWTLLGPLGNKALKKEPQKCPKRRQGSSKPLPKPPQNPFQTLPKSIEKCSRKKHGFGNRFFAIFLIFYLKIHGFFI